MLPGIWTHQWCPTTTDSAVPAWQAALHLINKILMVNIICRLCAQLLEIKCRPIGIYSVSQKRTQIVFINNFHKFTCQSISTISRRYVLQEIHTKDMYILYKLTKLNWHSFMKRCFKAITTTKVLIIKKL